LVLWCLTPLLTIFQLYRGGQLYEQLHLYIQITRICTVH